MFLPDIPVRITTPSSNETLVPMGGSFTLTCVAGYKTAIRWKHNGHPLLRTPQLQVVTSRDRVSRTLTSVLTVVNVTLLDMGRYTCQDVRDELNYQELEMRLSQPAKRE